MRSASTVCDGCGRVPVVMAGLCRRCYTKKINHRVLDRLETEFTPLTEANKFIFEKYLESTRERLVTDADVALAQKFSVYLSCYSVQPLTCWVEVLATSKAVGLSYVRRPPTGCPILQVGRKLESLGLIAPLKKEKIIERSRQILGLQEPAQSWVREYFFEVTKIHPSIYGLTAIAIIKRWSDFLGARSFAEGAIEDANAFIALMPEDSLGQSGNLIRKMRVFYECAKLNRSFLVGNQADVSKAEQAA